MNTLSSTNVPLKDSSFARGFRLSRLAAICMSLAIAGTAPDSWGQTRAEELMPIQSDLSRVLHDHQCRQGFTRVMVQPYCRDKSATWLSASWGRGKRAENLVETSRAISPSDTPSFIDSRTARAIRPSSLRVGV